MRVVLIIALNFLSVELEHGPLTLIFAVSVNCQSSPWPLFQTFLKKILFFLFRDLLGPLQLINFPRNCAMAPFSTSVYPLKSMDISRWVTFSSLGRVVLSIMLQVFRLRFLLCLDSGLRLSPTKDSLSLSFE